MKRELYEETFGPLSMWDQIRAFHKNFGLEAPERPIIPSPELAAYRLGFLDEELDELREAIKQNDKEETIDALVDIVVVAMGTAYLFGYDWDKHWNEVIRTQFGKVRAKSANQSKRSSTLDLVKPEGWKGPNHKQFIKE